MRTSRQSAFSPGLELNAHHIHRSRARSPAGRRATCYLQTLKYKQAIADFKKLLALEPQNQLVRMQLDSTQKILRKAEFEKVRVRFLVLWLFSSCSRPLPGPR